VRTFFHEALGCGQANPAASACDNRNFSRQFLSMVISHIFFYIKSVINELLLRWIISCVIGFLNGVNTPSRRNGVSPWL
jgi:hypothetical protein